MGGIVRERKRVPLIISSITTSSIAWARMPKPS